MKTEELLRYQAMYREIERALKTGLLTFGFPRRGEREVNHQDAESTNGQGRTMNRSCQPSAIGSKLSGIDLKLIAES